MQRDQYFAANSPADLEEQRLRALEELCDSASTRRLEALGVKSGWACLEVGAGGGSIARWLADRVGPSGRVVAADLNPRFLRGTALPTNVDVREHNLLAQDFESRTYNLVHCRALLVHLPEPERALARMAAAVRPGGCLLIEEADFSMFLSADARYAGAEQFNQTIRTVFDATKAAGIWDSYLGHRTPLLIDRLGFANAGYDCLPFVARGGDHPGGRFWSPTFRLSGPSLVASGAVAQTDLDRVLACFEDSSFHFVGGVLFGAWGRRSLHTNADSPGAR
jgi:SAM-dependent methyltransferase